CLNVYEPAFARPEIRGVELDAMVEVAIARNVVIRAHEVWRTRMLREPEDLFFCDTSAAQIGKQRMMPVNTAAEQIERKPLSQVEQFPCGLELARSSHGSQIICLNELGVGPHPAYRLHTQHGSLDLIKQGGEIT